jgi:replicative DNA helicase
MAMDSLKHADKLPPQNLDAERGLLGSLLLMNEAADDVADVLRSNHFYSDAHQRIYRAMFDLREKGVSGIDAVTLAEELSNRGELEDVGGVPYLMEILEAVPHAAHAKYYADIIRDKWTQRTLIYTCTDILKNCYEPGIETTTILEHAEQSVFRILEQQSGADNLAIGDILIDAFDRINERLEREATISGLSTGFHDLDHTTNGFQNSELVILAARPSMGKTAFVCNVAANVALLLNKGVLVFSLEQSKLELAERFLCLHSKINGHDLRAGNLDDDQRKLLMQGSSELSDIPLFLDDQPGRTMPQISAISRRLKRTCDLSLIIVDYLQLIEPDDKRQPREQQIAQITRRLKHMAKELDVPIIALAQLNRGVELREDKRPRLADLRESGAIEQDADLVMFLHRPEAYDPEDNPGVAEVIIAKHRSGPTGIVNLTWRKEYMRFENYTNLAEPEDGYFAGNDGSF